MMAVAVAPETDRGRDEKRDFTSRRFWSFSWRLFLVVNCVAIFTVAVFLRSWKLGNIPGINGDEAQYGVYAVEFLRGETIPWRTNTGNPLNPLFMGPQILLHSIWPASFTLLRVTAVLSGLAALWINFFISRRLFGIRTAVISTLFLTVLPVNIAYSRFAWDTCQTLAVTLLAMYCSLGAIIEPRWRGRWLIAAVVSGAASVLVHPTNVFIAPFPAIALVWPDRRRLIEFFLPRRESHRWLIGWLGLILLAVVVTSFSRHGIGIGTGRMPQRAEAVQFARNYVRLLSGVTVFRYIPGSQSAPDSDPAGSTFGLSHYDAVSWFVVAAVLSVWWLTWRNAAHPADAPLLLGWAGGAVGFFLVAGPGAIEPHWERYGLVLIAPAVLVVSRAMDRFLMLGRRPARVGGFALVCGGWLVLGGFHFNYFHFFATTGGRSQDTFRTAATEPKLTALRQVIAERGKNEPTWIVTSEWWNYWPIRYLATNESQLNVVFWHEAHELAGFESALASERVWFVEYTASEAHVDIRQQLRRRGYAYVETSLTDYAGKPLLTIISPKRARTFEQSRAVEVQH